MKALIVLTTLLLGSLAQASPLTVERRTQQMSCTLSIFFSVQPENRMRITSHLDGRGLLTCNSGQGFSTEVPVMADLEATLPSDFKMISEIAVSGNSTVFTIPREISQIQDVYTVRDISNRADSAPVLFRGKRNDIIMELKLSSQNSHAQSIQVKSMVVRFDETAPVLSGEY
jgi:hypothetical protein